MTDSQLIINKQVISNQQSLHDNLEAVVRRHNETTFQRPIADYSLRIFDQVHSLSNAHSGPLILDSFCGVGESTVNLAQQFPHALVVGIDKSRHRLDKHPANYRIKGVDNYLLARADVDDFWRLAVEANWQLSQHFLLYPNPWPKSAHLKRRVHGSPLFPSLLQLGGLLELRSNWSVYVKEFAKALTLSGYHAKAEPYLATKLITPFERKYHNTGQRLWHCVCSLE
ncbi:MAG: hypothetical protein V3T17_19725 [Pseudomonadales bacterium]